MFETVVTLIGTLIGEPTRRRYSTGSSTRFRLRAVERRFQPDNQTWVDGESMFVSVTCWRDLGEHVAKTLKRGDRVIVVGRLYHREYESENQHRLSVELDARAVGPDLNFCAGELEWIWDKPREQATLLPVAA
ncbi:single-stranded DNA-binding protein [Actinokineospora sp. NBRC 105648]|uniref:single-stranded DNA-binding protein n=1 Tax=Actinokineospora sp. NBRC 105648 TaxID=3032206 RepID=UPI0024A2CA81|nr:single-stranded DNA-binding protein [Actinokineospora sp. NBRC 105648]GLZ37774.1 hypothetical protein Acsp05_13990 [Actinokineospora sp. NBRC 105648]